MLKLLPLSVFWIWFVSLRYDHAIEAIGKDCHARRGWTSSEEEMVCGSVCGGAGAELQSPESNYGEGLSIRQTQGTFVVTGVGGWQFAWT